MRPMLLEGKVALVTGAGRGIGRAEALALAREGASVIVNDFGGAGDGAGHDETAAKQVAAEITAAGGRAVANTGSVAEDADTRAMVEQAVSEFGRLDILVNNAGILVDRAVFNLSAEEVSRLLSVHVMGHFNTIRYAGQHWRGRAKAGQNVSGRVINTSSASGVFGNFGQSGYGAAKAGIAALTEIASLELARYGVTVNAICPTARTRLTVAGSRTITDAPGAAGWDPLDPANVAPLAVFLASDAAAPITGHVFGVFGGLVQLYEGWRPGPKIQSPEGPFSPEELVKRWTELFDRVPPEWESLMPEVSADVRAALEAAGLSS